MKSRQNINRAVHYGAAEIDQYYIVKPLSLFIVSHYKHPLSSTT